MQIIIKQGGLDNSQVIALLRQHQQAMLDQSPQESVHTLDLSSLHSPEMTFIAAWFGDKLAGCGAIKQLDQTSGEIKSMRTSDDFLQQGVAANILQHLLVLAQQKGFHRVSLETGTAPQFFAAHRLYQRHGFEECAPFADYKLDPHSLFMRKYLT
ncbi:MAG: GNAT family N-acetyltransferase [Psychrobium sp.]|nr:GNAT family N-acetyltransferase [Psychrobium sp.]